MCGCAVVRAVVVVAVVVARSGGMGNKLELGLVSPGSRRGYRWCVGGGGRVLGGGAVCARWEPELTAYLCR